MVAPQRSTSGATPTLTTTSTLIGTQTPIGTRNPNETTIPAPTIAPIEIPSAIPEIISPPSKPSELSIFIFGTGLSSLISLMGFVSTTILGWRKEARDARVAELERKELEIRLEKERLELEKLPGVKPKQLTPYGSRTVEHGEIKFQGVPVRTARLKGLNGAVAGRVYPLTDGLLIGRSAQTSLQLSSPDVSRQHARLRFGGGRWFIQDMNSRGGIFVNGKQVDATALTNGDNIRIGSVEFEFND